MKAPTPRPPAARRPDPVDDAYSDEAGDRYERDLYQRGER